MPGAVAGGIYFNTESGLSAPGGLLDRLTNPETGLKQAQLDAVGAFRSVLPTDAAGNPDYGAMAKALYQKGAFGPANELTQAGLAQRQMTDASKLSAGMSSWLTPGGGGAQPSSTPAASSATQPSVKGGDPEVVGYIRERAPNWRINPNVALAVSAREGLRGFDPKGNANLGDDGSSAGPFQLHYGNVASGGNAAPGLGDDFTKATGLDARDPSTWKQQVDFALAHAAKNGWGAFHGARNAGIGEWVGIDRDGAQPATPAAGRPIQVAENGNSDAPPPSSQHPYAATSAGPTLPSQPPSAMAFTPAQNGPAVTPISGDAPQRPAPMPTQFVSNPPPLSPNAGALPHPADPSYGGQVPEAWLKSGHSAADWVKYLRGMAALGSANPYAKGAAEQWSKLADGLQTSIEKQNELTTQQKDARDPLVIKNQSDLATLKATARANAMTDTASRRAELTQEGEGYGKIPAQLATAADSARNQNEMIDAMVDAGRQFNMGKFAPAEQAFNSTMSALGRKLNVDTSEIDGKTAAYQVYTKILGQFTRTAMKEAGSRTGGIQEMQFVSGTLPSPSTSPDGLNAMANQMKGINDFAVAKQSAGEAWLDKTGSMRGFDTMWNKQVSPAAFVMHRLQVDQPQVFSTTVSRLAQSAQGRAALQHMRAGMAWAGSAGLLD